MQRFLNYQESNRHRLSSADLIMCMTHDVQELVQGGFMQIFKVAECSSKLILLLVFQIVTSMADGASPLLFVSSISPILVIPSSCVVFIRAREGTSLKMRTLQADCMFDVAGSALSTITNYRLIADYYQRPAEVERFLRRVRAYNTATMDGEHNKTNCS